MAFLLSPGTEFEANGACRAVCPRCSTTAQVALVAVAKNVEPGFTSFGVLACQACDGHLAFEGVSIDPGRFRFRLVRLFPAPAPVLSEAVPASVAASLAEAVVCQSVGATMAGALVTRRAIQLIVRDQAVSKGTLKVEINALPISVELREYAHAVRLIANEAAHPDPLDWEAVTPEDLSALVALSFEFVRQIYETPARVKALRGRAAEFERHV